MRKISKILFAGIIMSSALSTYAQTQIMTVKKTDGSKVIPVGGINLVHT